MAIDYLLFPTYSADVILTKSFWTAPCCLNLDLVLGFLSPASPFRTEGTLFKWVHRAFRVGSHSLQQRKDMWPAKRLYLRVSMVHIMVVDLALPLN